MTVNTLTVRQPWAWLLVHGPKDGENRSWPTAVRGVVAIHAGKTIEREAIDHLRIHAPEIKLPQHFETGKIIGFVNIADCVREHPSEWFSDDGGYFFVTDARAPWDGPAMNGRLGFFKTELSLSAVPDFLNRPS
jgi:hypothetical protein